MYFGFFLIAVLLGLLAIFAGLRYRTARRTGNVEGSVLAVLAVAILAATVVGLHEVEYVPVILFMGLVASFVAAWVHEFSFLMHQPDDAFNGHNDKLIWAILLIVLPPVGVVAFWSFRRAHGTEGRKPEPIPSSRDWF